MARMLALIAAMSLVSGCSVLPAGKGEPAKPRASTAKSVAITPAARQCLGKLNAAGASFIPKADAYGGKGCSTVNTVSLNALSGDRSRFEVTNLGTVSCPVATTFAAWTRFGVDRAARQILGSSVERVETMGSYACRNVAGSSRRSAHSTADAVDVAAFVLKDGRRITLSGGWNSSDRREREFLRAVHKSACKRFGTVLGPDYNAAHRDHFHLERGNGSFCR